MYTQLCVCVLFVCFVFHFADMFYLQVDFIFDKHGVSDTFLLTVVLF